eukprot:CAMPEP_0170652256 /NCGR_PEP_ID=MMETSP0224-20130122/46805_1 /TAXON_ID=285029 /ORGANISM="Togula jolla, Strain CCCM 725" /LENGTH=33 /DNA_ID= /DNA_START= /DNA_END= /DNA_ORIENTATION=
MLHFLGAAASSRLAVSTGSSAPAFGTNPGSYLR